MTLASVPEGLRTVTLGEGPDLESKVRSLPDAFPEFMYHDAAANRYWDGLFTDFSGFRIAICDEIDEVVAAGHCIPVFWDGTAEGLPGGLDDVLERGVEDLKLGRGLSSVVLEAMKGVAVENGLGAMIAPVRPTLKDRYPLTPMERYARWERPDGPPFDPWLRVHRRLGATFLRVAPGSMVIEGTISEWEEWTGMLFPESEAYVVPGALSPVLMDLDRDLGEPDVWMHHPVEE